MHHDDTHFTIPPGRRLGALALLRNLDGDVLIVEKKYKQGRARWGLPGGCAEANEDALEACQRHVRQKIGLDIQPGHLLAVHRMPAGDSAEGFNLVFDAGVIDRDAGFHLSEKLRSYQFIAPRDLDNYAAPYTVARIRSALDTLDGQPARYIAGHPV